MGVSTHANGLASGKRKQMILDSVASSLKKEAQLRVFISYSRLDTAFADCLVEVLEAMQFQVLIDRRDLPYGEEWKQELTDMVLNSDAVIWLISVGSIESKWVQWELGLVQRSGKKLIPIAVEEVSPERLPEGLGKLHILPAVGPFSIENHLTTLAETLNQDRQWLKQSNYYLSNAMRWERSGRKDSLLRGSALKEAVAWSTQQPKAAPNAAPVTLSWISASQSAQAQRWRTLAATTIVVGVSLAALAVFGLQQAHVARQAEVRAVEGEKIALSESERADQQAQLATIRANEAEEARILADQNAEQAEQQTRRAEAQTARLMMQMALVEGEACGSDCRTVRSAAFEGDDVRSLDHAYRVANGRSSRSEFDRLLRYKIALLDAPSPPANEMPYQVKTRSGWYLVDEAVEPAPGRVFVPVAGQSGFQSTGSYFRHSSSDHWSQDEHDWGTAAWLNDEGNVLVQQRFEAGGTNSSLFNFGIVRNLFSPFDFAEFDAGWYYVAPLPGQSSDQPEFNSDCTVFYPPLVFAVDPDDPENSYQRADVAGFSIQAPLIEQPGDQRGDCGQFPGLASLPVVDMTVQSISSYAAVLSDAFDSAPPAISSAGAIESYMHGEIFETGAFDLSEQELVDDWIDQRGLSRVELVERIEAPPQNECHQVWTFAASDQFVVGECVDGGNAFQQHYYI